MKGIRRAAVPSILGRTYDPLHASLVSHERSLVIGRRANVVDPRERRVRRRFGGLDMPAGRVGAELPAHQADL